VEPATKSRPGLLLVAIDPNDDLPALRAWYETEKLPAVRAVPGVSNATQWEVISRYVRAPQGGMVAEPAPPAYVVGYELDDVDVVRSEAFLDAVGRDFRQVANIDGKTIEFDQIMSVTLGEVMRRANPEADTVQARGMMVVSLSPRREYIDMMHEWYDTVHLGELMSCPGFLRTRRYQALDGIPNFFALYELEAPEALEGERFKGFSTRKFEELPAIQQKVGPNMTSNICDVYRLLD
jgi:hypothetical protein